MDALLRRRQMMLAGGSPAPVIEPVFYDKLKFDGTAYIVTNITPPEDASFRVNLGGETSKAAQRVFMVPAENGTILGAFYGNNTTSASRYFSIYYGASSAVSTTTYFAWSTATYSFWLTPKRFGWGDTANNITKGENKPNGAIILGYNASKSGNPYSGEMGLFRVYGSDAQNATSATDMYNNYTPVYTLRPCTYNGEAGMWCVETSTFFGNSAGAGTITAINN